MIFGAFYAKMYASGDNNIQPFLNAILSDL